MYSGCTCQNSDAQKAGSKLKKVIRVKIKHKVRIKDLEKMGSSKHRYLTLVHCSSQFS